MRTLALALLLLTGTSSPEGPVRPTAAMGTPRAAHTATPLTTGKVLLAGGCTGSGCELDGTTAAAELFDPRTGRFEPTGPMTSRRVGHSATSLADGRVLIAGGWNERGLTASAELYDPARGTFAPAGAMNAARGGFTATPLADGRVLIAGGSSDGRSLAGAELYDPATGEFSPTGSLALARSAHTASRLRNGRVLVVGGSNRGGVLRSAELYDPPTGRFSRASRLRVPRHKHAAVSLASGRVLVVGGSDERDYRGRYATAELYDPRRGFVAAGRMAAARFKLPDAIALLRSGRILVAGGAETVEVYDVARRRFTKVGRTGAELAFSTATTLPGGDVLVAGGYDPRIAVTARAWLVRAS